MRVSSCVLRLPRQLCWPRHGGRACHHAVHARGSSPTQDAVLGRPSGPAGGARPKLSRLAPRESFAPTLAHDVVQLRDAERLIIRTRWLAHALVAPAILR